MKFLVFLLVSSSAFAYDAPKEVWNEGFEVLANPSQTVNNLVCKNDDPKAPWCKDLFKNSCSLKKTSNSATALDQSLAVRFTSKIVGTSTQKERNDLYMNAIHAAELEVFGQSLVKRPDVVQVFMDAKTYLRQGITSNPYIPAQKQSQMADAIMTINLRTGSEYIEDMIVGLARIMPGDKETLRRSAIELYQSSCGRHGLDVNAFYENGKFIICPGLIQSLSDYGPKNKADVLNALAFTIGHEMGHAIDADQNPDVYSNMRNCYQAQSPMWGPKTACEISADYWGTLVMANRMRAQGVRGKDAANVVALATDGFCEQQPTELTGAFRVNSTMSTFPALRETLLCEGPTKETPACMIGGKSPR